MLARSNTSVTSKLTKPVIPIFAKSKLSRRLDIVSAASCPLAGVKCLTRKARTSIIRPEFEPRNGVQRSISPKIAASEGLDR